MHTLTHRRRSQPRKPQPARLEQSGCGVLVRGITTLKLATFGLPVDPLYLLSCCSGGVVRGQGHLHTPRIEPATFRLPADPLYLLSHMPLSDSGFFYAALIGGRLQ